MSAQLSNNIGRTLLLSFFESFLVIMPVAVPFFQSKGLSMQEVFALQALFGLVVLVTEVPSGYVADLLGRKRTLVLGAAFVGVGHSLLLNADGFWTLALFETALGIGHSLISGADIALLYDSAVTEPSAGEREGVPLAYEGSAGEREGAPLAHDPKPDRDARRQVVGRLHASRSLSEAAAGLVCSIVFLWWTMQELVIVQVITGWLPLVLALRLTEPPVERLPASAGHRSNMLRILRHLLLGDAVLRLTILAICIWGLTTFYAVWLIQKLWEQGGVSLAHFGYLWCALTVVAALAGRWAHKVEDAIGAPALLLVVGLLPVLGYLGLEGFGVVGGIVAGALFFAARGLGLVAFQDALNARVPSEFRATANSMASFGFRGAFVITGPLVGLSHDLWGMSVTLFALAGVSLAIFAGLILPLVVAAGRLTRKAPA